MTTVPGLDLHRTDISRAHARIAGDVRRTPLMRLRGADLGIDGVELWLKLEHLQVGGSFKARGMFNRMRDETIPAAGVVIASGGNAGIAVACAARALGVRCEVFLPATSGQAKRERLVQLGAAITVVGASYAEALAASVLRQAESGALWMHAYDQAGVAAGAGTLALEVEEDAGLPDRVLVSVGGGGLIAGIAAWFESRCRVEAVEPVGAATLFRARAAGAPVDVEVSGLAADALGARRIGHIAWTVSQQHVAASHLLEDDAIRAAQRLLWDQLRLAVEPAAALPLAALTTGTVAPEWGEKILLVLCGANFDPVTLSS